MKKVIKKSLVLVVLCTTMLSFANEFSIATNDIRDNITNLTLRNVEVGSILWIKDQNGLLVYKELIEKSGNYSKGFDLTALPNGNYSFELEKETEIKIIPFQVKSSVVIFNKKEEKVIMKPFVIKKGNFVVISKLSLEENPMEIKIYFENSDLVYSEMMNKGKVFQRKFDFSTSEKGTYKIVTKTEGREFSKTVKMD